MNIFILDMDVCKCVEYYIDKHVIKMILESAQMLCTAHWIAGSRAPYKKTHYNHPCAKWTRESLSNYKWLCKLALQICKEFTYRRGKIHKTQYVIEWCIENLPNIEDKGLTKFVLAMPNQYKCECPVESYRRYYVGEKRKIASYTKRNWPEFFNQQKYILENNKIKVEV